MKTDKSNIGYWEQVLKAPTPAYQELFDAEKKYLHDNIPQDSKVLDIGCGEGRNIKNILQKTKYVTGIDNEEKAINDAKENFKNNPTVDLVVAEATELPFQSETFDVVTFLMILPNLDNHKLEAIKESVRVLKNGGALILSTFSETAFEERMKIYKQTNVPIERIEGTKVVFDKSLGANTSEQFSKEELEKLGTEAGLIMVDCHRIGDIAYICKFQK